MCFIGQLAVCIQINANLTQDVTSFVYTEGQEGSMAPVSSARTRRCAREWELYHVSMAFTTFIILEKEQAYSAFNSDIKQIDNTTERTSPKRLDMCLAAPAKLLTH